ncbi:MAG: hypothetical protein QE269_12980 [Fimbriimonas sp.]|nr:hypothetical protein [Fimbriimonas sp.]
MIICNLTKLESAVDQIRKTHPKLLAADAALVASALSLTGRHAKAVYEGQYFIWPNDNEKLMVSMSAHLHSINAVIVESLPKKITKNTILDDEPVVVNIGLAPNLAAGEELLNTREDLKTMLSDILQAGVEFSYSSADIGWQWALDRANWNTISDGDLSRRIKIKALFTEGAVGSEQGTTTKKRTAKKAEDVVAAAVEEEVVAG